MTAQREGFEGSTFDEPSWRRMAAGAGYDPALDLVALTDDGEPAANGAALAAYRAAGFRPVETFQALTRSR